MSVVNDSNRDKLSRNPNVLSVTQKQIIYTDAFKIRALDEVHRGKKPSCIWKDNDFSISEFKPKYFKRCIERWRVQLQNGEIVHKKRGRPISETLTKDEEIEFLRAENKILKEYRALGVEGKIRSTGLSLELYRKIVDFHAPGSVNWEELARQAIISGWHDPKEN